MKHKHYDVIVAAAEGKVVQYLACDGEWIDYQGERVFAHLAFVSDKEYRIKPVTVDKWKWAYKTFLGAQEVTSGYYTSEGDVIRHYECQFEWLVKLEPTKITVEEN